MILSDKGLELKVWGESHGDAIGMILKGIREGEKIDIEALQAFVDRRKASKSPYSTTRREPDKIIVTKGIKNGMSTGESIEIEIKNTDQNPKDYGNLKFVPRPSHADYPAYIKYNGQMNMSGGGKFSGRLTAPICIAGGIAVQLLKKRNIEVGAYIGEIGGIKSTSYKDRDITLEEINKVKTLDFPVLDKEKGELMLDAIQKAKMELDSLGGVVEAVAFGVPVGTGESMFDSIESRIAPLMFGIPAVKGIEFGKGFDISKMKGSGANDQYYYDNGKVQTFTNHNGGILGGLANGMPITLRVAFKPTPSISREQKSVDLVKKENVSLVIKGRHDSCIVPRAVVVVEGATALALLDCVY